MKALPKSTPTEMEVTSIRLEKTLKAKLKDLAGSQGYQVLVREILWNYVQQKSGHYRPSFCQGDIRATFSATARKDVTCALTGKWIPENEPMLLGLTIYGDLVPLSLETLS